ncbi:OLC1v1019566C1 [Oldenlandia corymbosa var. corymbosa]|uniref:OLC1v1019566C1 n=1 Tax=Oldenlandia corymbosa var. corymbosa TaxID=529605 RepID=A0AAV1EEC4_OLDCO|nr:OLC1v1019566C1 [Oldenlandia corymbosa var. corymbosa]
MVGNAQSNRIKAYRAMSKLGYDSKVVKPVLNSLLEVYEQNWELIQDEDYAVLVDAVLESEESKLKESRRFHLIDEPEGEEPPPKKVRSTSRTDEPLTWGGVSSSSSDWQKDEPLHDVMKVTSESVREEKLATSAHCYVIEGDTEDEIDTPMQDCPAREQKCSSYYSSSEFAQTKKSHLFSPEGSYESNPLSPQPLPDDDCNYKSPSVHKLVTETHNLKACLENVQELPDSMSEPRPLAVVHPDHARSSIESDYSKAKRNFSTPPKVTELNTKDCSSSTKGPLLLGYHPKPKSSARDEESFWNGSRLDIASSCQGEVKLSVTFQSSLPSNFCVPRLDEVLKRMEEKYAEAYNITRQDFSIVKLMNEICETFLATGIMSSGNERVSRAELQPDPITSRDLDGQVVSNHVANIASVYIDPPRFRFLNGLDFSQSKIGLPMKLSGSYCDTYLEGLRNQSSSTAEIIVVAQHAFPNMMESAYLVDDITTGEENVKISLINEINNEGQPLFKYIPRNIVYREAHVKFLLARISDDNCGSHCFGDCLMAELPCACAGETGGEFAYLPGGLLKEKFLEDTILIKSSPQKKNFFYCQACPLERPKSKSLSGACKGHLIRKFIKECWYKCGCTMACGNRVVQRGINRKLQVFMTKEKGWGLRTLEDLPKGAFVCEYVGEIVTNTEMFDRNSRSIGKKHTYPVLLDADWCTEGVLKDEEALCLDATLFGNVARFINHRCHDANLVEIPVEVETPDHHYYHLAFFTNREVHTSEELTWDYDIDFNDHTHPVVAFRCRCESEFCRDLEIGNAGIKLLTL